MSKIPSGYKAVLYADIVNNRYKPTLARPVKVGANGSSPCGGHSDEFKVIAKNKWRAKDEFFVTLSSHAGCAWEIIVQSPIGLLNPSEIHST